MKMKLSEAIKIVWALADESIITCSEETAAAMIIVKVMEQRATEDDYTNEIPKKYLRDLCRKYNGHHQRPKFRVIIGGKDE